jgi:hypothetical protein
MTISLRERSTVRYGSNIITFHSNQKEKSCLVTTTKKYYEDDCYKIFLETLVTTKKLLAFWVLGRKRTVPQQNQYNIKNNLILSISSASALRVLGLGKKILAFSVLGIKRTVQQRTQYNI